MKVKTGDIFVLLYDKISYLEVARIDRNDEDTQEVSYVYFKKSLIERTFYPKYFEQAYKIYCKVDRAIVSTSGGALMYELAYPGFNKAYSLLTKEEQ